MTQRPYSKDTFIEIIYESGDTKISVSREPIYDMVSKTTFNKYCFRMFVNNKFKRLYNIGLFPHREQADPIRNYYKNAIEILTG